MQKRGKIEVQTHKINELESLFFDGNDTTFSVPMRESAMLIPPVPQRITLSATVFSLRGFRATTIGSFAGRSSSVSSW